MCDNKRLGSDLNNSEYFPNKQIHRRTKSTSDLSNVNSEEVSGKPKPYVIPALRAKKYVIPARRENTSGKSQYEKSDNSLNILEKKKHRRSKSDSNIPNIKITDSQLIHQPNKEESNYSQDQTLKIDTRDLDRDWRSKVDNPSPGTPQTPSIQVTDMDASPLDASLRSNGTECPSPIGSDFSDYSSASDYESELPSLNKQQILEKMQNKMQIFQKEVKLSHEEYERYCNAEKRYRSEGRDNDVDYAICQKEKFSQKEIKYTKKVKKLEVLIKQRNEKSTSPSSEQSGFPSPERAVSAENERDILEQQNDFLLDKQLDYRKEIKRLEKHIYRYNEDKQYYSEDKKIYDKNHDTAKKDHVSSLEAKMETKIKEAKDEIKNINAKIETISTEINKNSIRINEILRFERVKAEFKEFSIKLNEKM